MGACISPQKKTTWAQRLGQRGTAQDAAGRDIVPDYNPSRAS